MNVTTVIFDLDGTLLNTLDDLTDATNYALVKLGRTPIGTSDVRRFVGNGVPKLIERAMSFTASCGSKIDAELNAAALAEFTKYYDVHNADRTALYDGISEILTELNTRGIKTAVVTNKYDVAAQALKEKLFPIVDFVVGTSENVRPKPSSDGVNKALAALGAEKSSAIYVGDGETDMMTAKNAGLPVVAVTWGFRDRDLLASFEPNGIIDKPSELLDVLDGMGENYDA